MKRHKVLNLRDPPDKWGDMIINAAIMAGLGFFTTLASMGAVGLITDPTASLAAAGIAAGMEFFLSLALQRGLLKK